jgi:hypothetical protein
MWEWNCSSTILDLEGCEWSASRPVDFVSCEMAPGVHSIGGWMGPQRRSGRYREEKNRTPSVNGTPNFYPAARRCTDLAITALQREEHQLPGK